MHSELLCGIDVGTSAVKCIVTDPVGAVYARASVAYPPRPEGALEQDPRLWWQAVCQATRECLRTIDPSHLAAVSFSGHMSAPVLLDKRGDVLRPAILIADTRSDAETAWLEETYGGRIHSLCFNRPLNAFLAPKLLWCRRHEPECFAKAASVLFPKDYIRFRMCGGISTDRTDAGNSLLFDPVKNVWDEALSEQIGIPPALLPPVLPSGEVCAAVSHSAASETGLPEGLPIVTGAADMACSQLGTGAFEPGVAALTLSTSIQIVEPAPHPVGALSASMTWHPSAFENGMYVMASVFAGGLSLDWILQLLSAGAPLTPRDYADWNSRLIARRKAHPQRKALFLPFLTGSGSPRFNPAERGAFLELSASVTAEDLVLAVLEGVALHARENVDLLTRYLPAARFHLAGGGCRMTVWPQIFADVLGRELTLLENPDVSALGAAMLAARGAGFTDSVRNAVVRTVVPAEGAHYQALYDAYLDRAAAARRNSEHIV